MSSFPAQPIEGQPLFRGERNDEDMSPGVEVVTPVPGQIVRSAIPQTPQEALVRLQRDHETLTKMLGLVNAQLVAIQQEQSALGAQLDDAELAEEDALLNSSHIEEEDPLDYLRRANEDADALLEDL